MRGTFIISTRFAPLIGRRGRTHLQKQGIQTGIHYPIPVHLLPAYADLGYRQGQFPHAEKAAAEVLSLPMFPELSSAQCETVSAAIRKLAQSNQAVA